MLLSEFFHGVVCAWPGAVYSVMHICSATAAAAPTGLSRGPHPSLGAVFSAACPWGCRAVSYGNCTPGR